MVRNHWDEQTRRRFKVSVGSAGKQVINVRIAGQTLADGHSNRVKDSQILLERENDVKGKSGKGGGKNGKSKDAGALVWNHQPSPVASSVASSAP